MVIKILGGKKASIRYQLKNPTARILHGDPAVTQRLIDGSHFSQKYCGIVLSFEENIAAETESANRAARLVKLIATCGPLDIDDPQPAITIMQPGED